MSEKKIILMLCVLFFAACTPADKENLDSVVTDTTAISVVDNNELLNGSKFYKISNLEKIEELRIAILDQQKEQQRIYFESKSIPERYKLGDTTAILPLINLLSTSSYETVNQTLIELKTSYETYPGYGFNDNRLKNSLFNLLNDENTVENAIQICGAYAIEGYDTTFQNKILKPNSKHLGRYFYWLARNGHITDTIYDHVENIVKNQTIDDRTLNDIYLGFEYYFKAGKKEYRTRIGKHCIEIFEKKNLLKILQKQRDQNIKGGYASSISKCILSFNDTKTIPIANKLLNSGLFEEKALVTLVKLNGEKELNRIIKNIQDTTKFDVTLSAAKILHDSLELDTIIPLLLLKSLNNFKRNDPVRIDNVVEILIKIHEEGRFDELDSIIVSEELKQDVLFSYELINKDPYDIAAALYHIGLSQKEYSKDKIEAARKSTLYFGDKSHIYNMLQFSDLFVSLDSTVENKVLLPTMEYIFANIDGTIDEILIGSITENDSTQSLTFIINQNAYRYVNHRPSITHSEIIEVVNKILQDNNKSVYFHPVGNYSEKFQYIFGMQQLVKHFYDNVITTNEISTNEI